MRKFYQNESYQSPLTGIIFLPITSKETLPESPRSPVEILPKSLPTRKIVLPECPPQEYFLPESSPGGNHTRVLSQGQSSYQINLPPRKFCQSSPPVKIMPKSLPTRKIFLPESPLSEEILPSGVLPQWESYQSPLTGKIFLPDSPPPREILPESPPSVEILPKSPLTRKIFLPESPLPEEILPVLPPVEYCQRVLPQGRSSCQRVLPQRIFYKNPPPVNPTNETSPSISFQSVNLLYMES